MRNVLPIVEGDGDLRAVPELLRRILVDHGRFDVQILAPHKRGDLPKVVANFDRFFEVALLEGAPILWVLDFDCDYCDDVSREESNLKNKAAKIRAAHPFEVCFLVKEFEALFLCDEDTTRKVFPAIPETVVFPQDFENVRGAKEWLCSALPKGLSYKPTTHQQKLTSQLNLETLRARSPSFVRLESALVKLIS
jgi:hypothetical protein